MKPFQVARFMRLVGGGPTEIFFDKVSQLLHFNGADGGTTFTDVIGSAWAASGGAQLDTAQSKFGGASLLLDGAGDYISTTLFGAIGINDFTVEGWVRIASLASDGEIYCISNVSTGTSTFNLVFEAKSTGALRGSIQNGSGGTNVDITSAAALLTVNTWHHVAFTAFQSTAKLWIDGVEVASGAITGTRVNQQTNCRIGYLSSDFSGTVARYFNGHIDDLRVTRGVCRYFGTFTPSAVQFPDAQTYDDNLLSVSSLLHFDGADASTVIVDSMGRAWTASGNAQLDTAQQKFGGSSLLIDGTGDYVSTPDNAAFDFGSGSATIEFWIRPGSVTGFRNLIRKSTGINYAPILVGLDGDKIRTLMSNDTVSWQIDITSTDALTIGTWAHVAIVKNGSAVTQYINGVANGTGTITGALMTNASAVYVGARSDGSDAFNGHMDEVRITKGVARYTAAFTPPTDPFPNYAPSSLDGSYANVSTLLHFDAVDGFAAIEDAKNKVWTVGSNAQVKTDQSRFGHSSLYLDGGDDKITSTDAAIIDLNEDFTVEMWVRVTSAGVTLRVLVHFYNSAAGSNQGLNIYRESSTGVLRVDNGITAMTAGTEVIPLNTWTHVAVTRASGTIRGFVNGVEALSHAAQSYPTTITLSSVGELRGGLYDYLGHIDDLRVTKGVARYTAGFTPPTAPFPGS